MRKTCFNFICVLTAILVIAVPTFSIAQKGTLTSKTATASLGYTLVNPGESILLYKYQHQGHSAKEADRYAPKYYFTTPSADTLKALTKNNLKKAFPTNHTFHDAIDANFNKDEELINYDDFHKIYKLNRLLQNDNTSKSDLSPGDSMSRDTMKMVHSMKMDRNMKKSMRNDSMKMDHSMKKSMRNDSMKMDHSMRKSMSNDTMKMDHSMRKSMNEDSMKMDHSMRKSRNDDTMKMGNNLRKSMSDDTLNMDHSRMTVMGDDTMKMDNIMMASMSSTMDKMHTMKMSGDFDHDFAHKMIMHQQAAIDMSDVEIAQGKDAQIITLAKNTITVQKKEIDQMQLFIKNYKVPEVKTKDAEIHPEMSMDMKSRMDKMNHMKTTGNTDQDFITMMIAHHECAVTMAEDEWTNGKQLELKKIAQTIITTRKMEIVDFKAMLINLN